jgi:hypothetical protein
VERIEGSKMTKPAWFWAVRSKKRIRRPDKSSGVEGAE